MTDDISISYSQSFGNATAPAANSNETQDMFAFADCELVPIDAHKMLVINRTNGKQQFFQPGVVEALKTCTRFDTISGHAQSLTEQRPELQGQKGAVEKTLQGLAESGFLIRSTAIKQTLSRPAPVKAAPSRVFIVTSDRTEAVARLLESMLRNANLGQHDALVLVDDSRSQANRMRNQDLVEDFNIRSPKNMHYFGEAEQRALLGHLIDGLPEHEGALRFLIDQDAWPDSKTYGRSRTLCLLLSVGYRAVVLDDDIVCEAIAPPVREEGISFSGQRQAVFYSDREELQNAAAPAAIDPLVGHLDHLGHSLGEVLSEKYGELKGEWLQHANAAMLNELDPSETILITQCGSWGDPGTGNAHWAINLDESSIERLVSASSGMAAALESRSSWFGCPQPTLHKMAFMSQMTGVDNSKLLPPYFPAFRGEDLLFATMVEAMYPHSAVFEMDWSVPHLPLEQRSFSLREPIAGEGGIVLFTRWLAEQIDYKDRREPTARIAWLGNLTAQLAGRSDEDLLVDYRREQAKGQAHLLFNLTSKLVAAQELPSQNWTAYLKRAIEEVERSISQPHSPVAIKGVPAGISEAALLSRFRSMAAQWSEALVAWPAIREAAADFPLQK